MVIKISSKWGCTEHTINYIYDTKLRERNKESKSYK